MLKRKRSSKSAKQKPTRAHRLSSSQPVSKKMDELRTKAKPTAPADGKISKQEIVVGMLREPAGVSIAEIMVVTGWQEHSVRGFLAAVVKKRLGLSLVSERTGGKRVYRIETRDPIS